MSSAVIPKRFITDMTDEIGCSVYVCDVQIGASSPDISTKAFLCVSSVTSDPTLTVFAVVNENGTKQGGVWQSILTTDALQDHISNDCGSGEIVENFGGNFGRALKNNPSLHETARLIRDSCCERFPLGLHYVICGNAVDTVFQLPLLQFPIDYRVFEAAYSLTLQRNTPPDITAQTSVGVGGGGNDGEHMILPGTAQVQASTRASAYLVFYGHLCRRLDLFHNFHNMAHTYCP